MAPAFAGPNRSFDGRTTSMRGGGTMSASKAVAAEGSDGMEWYNPAGMIGGRHPPFYATALTRQQALHECRVFNRAR
jgi:hypothetical protein